MLPINTRNLLSMGRAKSLLLLGITIAFVMFQFLAWQLAICPCATEEMDDHLPHQTRIIQPFLLSVNEVSVGAQEAQNSVADPPLISISDTAQQVRLRDPLQKWRQNACLQRQYMPVWLETNRILL